MIRLCTAILCYIVGITGYSQTGFTISGKITEALTGKPMQNATVHLEGSDHSTLSKIDGSFRIHTENWYDTLEITNLGFEEFKMALLKGHTANLELEMKNKIGELQEVVVGSSIKPGKSFMEKVIERKELNNPSRFRSYSYQQYKRHELDISNIDFQKAKGNGLKGLLLKTYAGFDSSAKDDKELPVYFSESIANNYHSVSPNIETENIVAKKKLGLKTDAFLSRLDKFYFHFNLYDDWLPIFDQTYVSPLNSNAFSYYKFIEGDTAREDDHIIRQIRFMPLRPYERAFSGTLWINESSLVVETVFMNMSKTANLDFVKNISYSEEYKLVFDSASGKPVYMPYKYSSEIKFESGLELLGIPTPGDKKSVTLIIKNTTVTDKLNLNTDEPTAVAAILIKKEQTTNWDKPEMYWELGRLDSLSTHEKNIYKMVDSLKENKRFQRDLKLVAFAGTGYWDFGKQLRVGTISSFISKNSLEGWRIRVGFWTMPGISKKFNLYGYGAYGTQDRRLKGMAGIKYIWNEPHWTKTSLTYGSDYDFVIDADDELDKDNIFNSLLRKNIPFTRTYVKQTLLKHEQYLTPDVTAKASLSYKELDPVFDFSYHPINPVWDKPNDSILAKKLPVAEASIGLRYAHKERSTMLNYDLIRLGTFSPVLTINYTYGFEQAKAEFEYHKIDAGIEQRLRLPPRSMLYYKLEAGKIFGTIPYLLLNIPAGNEYYVASKYLFNTMAPYEFAADRYLSLHTRFYFGGVLLDKIPWLRKLGWRERVSFNSYWGDMTKANIDYNKNSNFNLTGKTPFMEASAGIENIFHVLSVEYYRRLSHLNNPYAKRGGIYLGITLSF
jgi:hypothetical protein